MEENKELKNDSTESVDDVNFDIPEDGEITEETMRQIESTLRQIRKMTECVQSIWDGTRREFNLTPEVINKLYQYNEQHAVPKPAVLSAEGESKWDRFNGIDNITEEEAIGIFGKNHPIIAVYIDQTRDRLKEVLTDYTTWVDTVKEYNETERSYRYLCELNENKNIEKMKILAEAETDEEKKANVLKSIDDYYYNKYLGFMAEPLKESAKKKLIDSFGDSTTINYWIKRTRDKLKSLNISQQFILEVSKFEMRFLPQRYHKLSNMLLLYFMYKIVFSDMGNKKGNDRALVMNMILTLDSVIRNTIIPEYKQTVLDNIMKYLDQVIEPIYQKYYPTEIIIPKEEVTE